MLFNAVYRKRLRDCRYCLCLLLVCALFTAAPLQADTVFNQAFEKHSAVMLLIEPASGRIVAANAAASRFYGYPPETLTGMAIQDINQLTDEQVAAERRLARSEGRNYFIFRHQLADGSVRTVEVHAVPLNIDGQPLLHSIIRDISAERDLQNELWHYQTQLETMADMKTEGLQRSYRTNMWMMAVALINLIGLAVLLGLALRRSRHSAQQAKQAEQRQREVIWGTNVGTWEWNIATGEVKLNERWADIIGYTLPDLEPLSIDTWKQFVHPDDRQKMERQLLQVFKRERDYYECECRMQHADGQWIWVLDRGKVVEWGAQDEPLRMSGTHTDISARKRAELKLQGALSQLQATLQATDNGILVTGASGRVLEANRQYLEMWQVPGWMIDYGDELQLLEYVKQQLLDPEQFMADVEALHASQSVDESSLLTFADGRVFECNSKPIAPDGHPAGRVWSYRDITAQRRTQQEIQRLALTDALTGLANRNQFNQRFTECLSLARREKRHLALMLLDMDRFKQVNDSFGHPVGDALLQQVAAVFNESCRQSDLIARIGGDEFAIIMVFPRDRDASAACARRIIDSLKKPLTVADQQLETGVSIGISLFPDDAEDTTELMHKADQALYQAKREGRNRYRFYNA